MIFVTSTHERFMILEAPSAFDAIQFASMEFGVRPDDCSLVDDVSADVELRFSGHDGGYPPTKRLQVRRRVTPHGWDVWRELGVDRGLHQLRVEREEAALAAIEAAKLKAPGPSKKKAKRRS